MPSGTYDRYETHRKKIQTGMILESIRKIHRGEIKGDPKMLAVRLRAGEILLRKALPDLSSVSITGGENGEPLQIVVNVLEKRKA